jgi:hypothetical protein
MGAGVFVTVSVDLAFRLYASFGIAVLADNGKTIRVELVKAAALGLTDPPEATCFAARLKDLCDERGARVLLLDGPLAWKDPNNGLAHQRVCEKLLHTPAKTGLPGEAKPKPYLPFVSFSIAVGDALIGTGARRLAGPNVVLDGEPLLVLESFPTASWSGIGLPPLRGKAKAKTNEIQARYHALCHARGIVANRAPNHDELQALVAGLAGVAIGRGAMNEYRVVGDPPRLVTGVWREGYIVIPSNATSTSLTRGSSHVY